VSRCKVFGQLPCYGVCAGRCARVLKQHSTHSFRTTTVQTLRSDNFNRADTTSAIGTPSDAGSAWVQQSGTWGISSNQAYESASTVQASCVLEANAANVSVQATIATLSAAVGIVARAADDNNYLVATIVPTQAILYKRVAGSFIQLGATFVGAFSNGDVIKLVVDSGNNITVYQNGVSIITATDSAGSTNTKHGLRANADLTSRFDNFSITSP
jgi:hypothetical protein